MAIFISIPLHGAGDFPPGLRTQPGPVDRIQSCRHVSRAEGTSALCPEGPCTTWLGLPLLRGTHWGEAPGPTGRAQCPALSLQSSDKDIVEALGHGSIYATYRATGQVRRANTSIQRWSEVRAGPQGSPHPGKQDEQGGTRPVSKLGTPLGPCRASPLECPTVPCTRDPHLHSSHQLQGG